MRFGYSWLKQSVRFCPKQIVMGLSLIALPVSVCFNRAAASGEKPLPSLPVRAKAPVGGAATAISERLDPRAARLRNFLLRLHCPVSNMAGDFVRAADENHLDWRLLPSISVVESGGGKAYRNNNIFGWANGNKPFDSVRAGIREVAFKLSRGPRYRNQDVAGKLRVYNPDEDYAPAVLRLMNRISPASDARQVIYQRD